jgi:hypothetical protein
MRPERQSRAADENRAARESITTDTSIVPETGDPNCCGALDFDALAWCARRGLMCGPDGCVRRGWSE